MQDLQFKDGSVKLGVKDPNNTIYNDDFYENIYKNQTETIPEYEQYLKDIQDRIRDSEKLSHWDNAPDEAKYLKNKEVYDNPKFFDQDTGTENWPGQNGDPNIDGFKNGKFTNRNTIKGEKIDRFGGNDGTFFGETGTPIEKRAMSPNSNFDAYNKYEVVRPFPVREGEIAPWFDQPGGGIQYKLDPNFERFIRSQSIESDEQLIDIMIRLKYLKRV